MKKILILLFGVIAYKTFLTAFLYAIGFVTNLFVPKSIDGNNHSISLSAMLIDSLLLGLFAVQHSVMARPAFKRWITRFIDPAIERSLFVLVASLLLLLMYWQWQSIDVIVWKTTGIVAIIMQTLALVGWLIVLAATFMINHFDLFGLKQVIDNMRQKTVGDSNFKVSWLYRIVRHPIMLGFLIAFWFTPAMTVGHLLFSILTTAYIIIAVKFFEERDLIRSHGKQYLEYKKKVPMFVPFTK
jgi:methanethiol S-methyltransferase